MSNYNLPPLQDVLSWIESFQTAKQAERLEIIDRAVSAHVILNFEFAASDRRLYRARTIESEKRPRDYKGVIWPPNAAPGKGRVSGRTHRVIYLSRVGFTSVAEIGAHEQQTTLTEFGNRKNTTYTLSPIGEFMRISRSGVSELLGDKCKYVERTLSGLSHADLQTTLILDCFLHDCMMNRDEDYVLSGRVANAIFSKFGNIDGIAYPSIRHPGSMNIAIRIDRFWKSWGIVSVRQSYVRHLAHGIYDLSDGPIVGHISNEGDFIWSDTDWSFHKQKRFPDPWYPLAAN